MDISDPPFPHHRKASRDESANFASSAMWLLGKQKDLGPILNIHKKAKCNEYTCIPAWGKGRQETPRGSKDSRHNLLYLHYREAIHFTLSMDLTVPPNAVIPFLARWREGIRDQEEVWAFRSILVLSSSRDPTHSKLLGQQSVRFWEQEAKFFPVGQ